MFVQKVNWLEELPTIKQLGLEGWTLTQLAEKYKVSKQRMKQITQRHIPTWKEEYGNAVKRKNAEREWLAKWGKKEDTDLYKIQRLKFTSKKHGALKTGFTWDLQFGDLEWPTHCPILGLEIDYFAETRQENSPSFDRIDSNLGYVKGNVHILSWRANRIKNDGTSEEHRKIAAYIDSLL